LFETYRRQYRCHRHEIFSEKTAMKCSVSEEDVAAPARPINRNVAATWPSCITSRPNAGGAARWSPLRRCTLFLAALTGPSRTSGGKRWCGLSTLSVSGAPCANSPAPVPSPASSPGYGVPRAGRTTNAVIWLDERARFVARDPAGHVRQPELAGQDESSADVGPDAISANFESYWVYVAGPLLGAILAVGVAFVLRCRGGGGPGRRQRKVRSTWRWPGPGRLDRPAGDCGVGG